jgi:hypothetical protein
MVKKIDRLVKKVGENLKTFGLIARLAGFFCFCSSLLKSKKCLQLRGLRVAKRRIYLSGQIFINAEALFYLSGWIFVNAKAII